MNKSLKILNLIFFLKVFILASGCSALKQRYSQDDIEKNFAYCTTQSQKNQRHKDSDWFMKDAICLRTRVMPAQIYLHQEKEKEIEAIYENLMKLAESVSSKKIDIDQAYAEWDKTIREQLQLRCFLSSINNSGQKRCVRYVGIED